MDDKTRGAIIEKEGIEMIRSMVSRVRNVANYTLNGSLGGARFTGRLVGDFKRKYIDRSIEQMFEHLKKKHNL